MKWIVCIGMIFIFTACDKDAERLMVKHKERGYVYTDDGQKTWCKRVKIDSKEYFLCDTTHGYTVITPVK